MWRGRRKGGKKQAADEQKRKPKDGEDTVTIDG